MIELQNITGYPAEDPGFALLKEVAKKYCPEEWQNLRKSIVSDELLEEALDLSSLAALDPSFAQAPTSGLHFPSAENSIPSHSGGIGEGLQPLGATELSSLHYEEVDTLNSEQIKKDFPVLRQKVNGHDLVWLDNGATTQKPNQVIDKISDYYRNYNSNIHRGAHTLAARATDAYEEAREKVQHFINAGSSEEIVFVRGTTEGINLVAQTYGIQFLTPGDDVIVSELDHHANIVPWQRV